MSEHTGCLQHCYAGTRRRISAVLWFSLNPCGLNPCSTVATWGDGTPCCVPPQLLREPLTQGPFSSFLFGNISMLCTEKTSLGRLCCCRGTLGTVNGKNTCSSSRHCSPFSLAGRGEGCHYFTDESGKSSVFAVLNVSNMIIAGLKLEFGSIRKLLEGKEKKRKQ